MPDVQTQMQLAQWAIDKGGAYVVILVVLFFYRRDWQTAVNFWKDQHAVTVKLVVESTRAQDAVAAALHENNVIFHQAKRVLEHFLPEIQLRRAEDDRAQQPRQDRKDPNQRN